MAAVVGEEDTAARRRRIMARPTVHRADEMLGSVAGQASGGPPRLRSGEEEHSCGALPEDDFKQQLMDPFKE